MTIIADVGETFTIREITRTFNEYGDPTESVSASTISGLIVPMNASSEEVKSGILDMKDAFGFFASSDQSKIKDGNEIYCTLGSFTLQNVFPFNISDTIHHVEAELKRIPKL